ncbi:hypothetical protein FXF51_01970 [Nonomuraea sp. PA05]|uniref:hypothetical protein n=1 Tax=Nonomuraea sp. PA05 TaxID=2604466 RepID=UPI0011DC6E1F|nr:hypothetical protein [Nonomuraea sp. PA05]TYB71228.1 hypothetical protein FXF51_01970 [Nonomuraea sp. PA05]
MTDLPRPLNRVFPEGIDPLYPVTIVKTRYSGSYEGGTFAAFLTEPWDVPQDAFADDRVAYGWWKEHGGMIGVGDTPDEALASLRSKLT